MSTTKGSKRVADYLKENNIEARIVTLDESTRTSQLAADALGCTIAEIAKSIVFIGEAQAVVVVISGDRRVDAKKVSAFLGFKVGNANADAVKLLTGYVIGGVPPFPHKPSVRVLLDQSLKRFDNVWAAAGTPNSVVNISVAQLQGQVGDFVDVAI